MPNAVLFYGLQDFAAVSISFKPLHALGLGIPFHTYLDTTRTSPLRLLRPFYISFCITLFNL